MGTCHSTNERRKGRKKSKEESQETSTKANDEKEEKENKNLKKNQNKNEMNIYLICPDCNTRSPHIEKLYYDEKNEDFCIKYTCICNKSQMNPKNVSLKTILSNKEPVNTCNIHPDIEIINFCKDCHKPICKICKDEYHNDHKLENNNINISKDEADKMLEIIKQKEEQFKKEINKNGEKKENAVDNDIQQINIEKQKLQKTFDFLKNLYERYFNNCEFNENNNKLNTNNSNSDSNRNEDNSLASHLSKNPKNNNMIKLNSNVDDNGEEKDNEDSINNNPNEISKSHVSNKKKEYSCIHTFEGHTDKIVSLIQLASGKLASGSYDNTIRIWNMDNLKEDKIINERGRVFTLLEFEKNKLLTGNSDNAINLWDINSKNDKCLYTFLGHKLWINCLVKINNNYFASASNDSNIKIWNYYNRKCIYNLEGHSDCVLTLILLKNNYLCSGGADLTIKIWDWEKENCISTLTGHQKWVKSVFELDNEILVSGSDDKTIKLWKDYNLISTLDGHNHSVRAFCQINKEYFCSGSFDSTIKIWKINTWECVQTLNAHKSNIICIISLKGKNDKNNYKCNSIASCSNDKTIKIWEGNI